MQVDDYEITFTSGTKKDSWFGSIGIDNSLDIFSLCEAGDFDYYKLKKEDRLELADFMIARWNEYKNKNKGK
jgi:hypothetical protein